MLAVAGEQLVCALPGESHGDVPRRELGQPAEAERGEVGERLVHVPAQVLQVDSVVERQLELVVVGAEDVRHVPCIR